MFSESSRGRSFPAPMGLHFAQAIGLLAAAGIAGALNALAGGGSFISSRIVVHGHPAGGSECHQYGRALARVGPSAMAYLKRLNAPAASFGAVDGDQRSRRMGRALLC